MKKITHFLKMNKSKLFLGMIAVFSLPIIVHAAVTTTVIKFTPVTVTKVESNAIIASTKITYSNSSKPANTSVNGPKIDAVLYKKTLLGLSSSEVKRVTIENTPVKYNTSTQVAAKFPGLKDSEEYWVTFNEHDLSATVIASEKFTLASKTLTLGGGSFGGGGSSGSWTEDVPTQPQNTTVPTVPVVPTNTPPKPKPANVPADAEPIPRTTYELEFHFLPDAYLDTLKAKGSVTFTSSDGSKGVLAGTITLTPITYYGDRLTTETFTLPNINVESGKTYPLEFTFKQDFTLGVIITKVELGSLDDTSIFAVKGTLDGPATNVINGADGKPVATFSISKSEHNSIKKTITLIGNITYTDIFSITDKYNKILADIYSDGEKISTKNIVITKAATGNTLEFNSVVTNIDPSKIPTTFKIRDTHAGIVSNLFPITPTSSQAAQGGITNQVIDSATAADGTKVNFTINAKDPVVSGTKTDITFSGSVTYSSFANTSKLGKLVFTVFDKNNKIVKTESLEMMQSVIESGKPQEFSESLTIDSINLPFSVKIKDTGLGVESKSFTLAKVVVQNNNPVSPTSPQTSSVTVPSGEFKGKKVDIVIDTVKIIAGVDTDTKLAKKLPNFFVSYAEAQETKTATIQVSGSIKYNDFNVTDVNKIGKIKFTLKGKDGLVATNEDVDVVSLSGTDLSAPIPIRTDFNNIDPTKGPFTVEITEKDLGVTSSAFRVAGQAGDTNADTNGDGVIDANEANIAAAGTSSNRLSLVNPLAAAGLDSIPAVVSVLVKDIVIPIAVPFLGLSIIYTGFLFVQARGNKDKLEKAKEALKYTLIGGALILGAYVIATALQSTISQIIQ